MTDVAEKVIPIICKKLGVAENKVTPTANFAGDLGADSLGMVELIMEFEKVFEITVPDEKAESIKTVGDAIKYIESVVNS